MRPSSNDGCWSTSGALGTADGGASGLLCRCGGYLHYGTILLIRRGTTVARCSKEKMHKYEWAVQSQQRSLSLQQDSAPLIWEIFSFFHSTRARGCATCRITLYYELSASHRQPSTSHRQCEYSFTNLSKLALPTSQRTATEH